MPWGAGELSLSSCCHVGTGLPWSHNSSGTGERLSVLLQSLLSLSSLLCWPCVKAFDLMRSGEAGLLVKHALGRAFLSIGLWLLITG